MRQVHHLEQGSPEWHAHRATPDQINGSEIAAIMGLSSYVSRAEMLRRKATGIEPEYDAATLARFADGHRCEELARPLAEAIIDDDLSPLVMTDLIDGVLLSVSLDGITQGYDTTHEHKRLNITLADALDAGCLPDEYHPQCEAGLMVSGATRCLFMASKDGDPDTAQHYWYESRPELRPRMIAACKQFLEDKANYVHVETVAAPVAATIEALPALFVQVEGKVLATNLDAFKLSAQKFIDGIKTELVNDQDFADADKMVKFLKDGEERLALAKSQALAQTASIDELFRAVDAISEQMKAKRLALDKLVKSEKESRRGAIVSEAQQALMQHRAALTQRIGGNWLPPLNPGVFSEAIKGLKSIDSMRDKVATALAQAKIEANEIADLIESNRKSLEPGNGCGDDYIFLLQDFASVCTKSRDDFSALVAVRLAAHREKEEQARERIRQEEAAKLQAQQDQRGKADAGMGQEQSSRAQPEAASTPPIQQSEMGQSLNGLAGKSVRVMNHTPEPWDYDEVSLEIYSHETGDDVNLNNGSDVRRIVACVNACAGIDPHDLETAGSLATAEESTLRRLASERDTLRTALQTQAEEAAKMMAQRDNLHAIVCQCLDAMDNGAGATEECSIEFLSDAPTEVGLVVAELKRQRDELVTWLRWSLNLVPTDVRDTWQYEQARAALAKAEATNA